MHPDRIVLGAESSRAEKRLRQLYLPLSQHHHTVIVTGLESAELIKYAANAFLATKISFINEISVLCEEVGADVQAVAKGIGLDKRIGEKFLQAGPGHGGSCFPKDTRALVHIAQANKVRCRIVEVVVEVNECQRARMVSKIRDAVGGCLGGKVIAVLGSAFKPNTDDMREAPSLKILPALAKDGAVIRAHDPHAIPAARQMLPSTLNFFGDAYEMCRDTDAVVLMTDWDEYNGLDLVKLTENMRSKNFIDLRNIYDPRHMAKIGLNYFSVGRRSVATKF